LIWLDYSAGGSAPRGGNSGIAVAFCRARVPGCWLDPI
jgi:hypothetical protein